MNDKDEITMTAASRLPSGEVIEVLLNRFKEFIGTGYTSYDEVVTLDNVKYIILCSFHAKEHINGMRVYAVHEDKHPELAVSLSMLEWET